MVTKNRQTDADDQAEHDRAHRAGIAGGRRDRDQTGHAARQRAEQRGLALEHPLGEHPRHGSSRGGDEGVDHRQRRAAVGFEVRSGVEAEPADPQQRGADHGHGQRVRSHQLLAVAGALADQQRADQARDTGIDVHHGAAGEVDRAPDEDLTGVRH